MIQRVLRRPSWKAYLLAARPKTLTAALVPVVVATALAAALGTAVSFPVALFTLASALCIQIGTNLVNDALDFLKGADGERRTGPLRATQQGFLSHRQVLAAGALFFLLALAAGVPLILKGGAPIALLLLLSIALGYGYTGGPAPLAYIGMGELFVLLFFGIAAAVAATFLQTGALEPLALLAGVQVGLHATAMIAINNLRDREEDALAGKRTLAVRWGKRFSRIEITAALLLPFLLNGFWWQQGFKAAALFPFITLPLALHVAFSVWKSAPGRKYNRYLARAAALHLLFGALLSAGLSLL